MGSRVVVRRVVAWRDTRPVFSDILGELLEFTEESLTVRNSDGIPVRVPRPHIVAAKVVPPRAPSRREIVTLERVAAAGWPAVETRPLGGWLMRAAAGWTSRANSVLALGDPEMPLPQALDLVQAWYLDRGLRPRFALPLAVSRALDRELAARGWQASPQVLVQTAPLDRVRDALPDRPDLPPVRITPDPDEDWLHVAAKRKGPLSSQATQVLTGARCPGFASLYQAGELVAIGRGVTVDGWLGLSLVEVTPAARRRGLARQVIAALVRWASTHGAERAYLQVEADNEAAVGLYADLGFSTHHTYLHRTAPDGPA